MTTTIVSSAAALNTALLHARAGDTIELAAGTYAGVNLTNLNFSTSVSITSVDPNHPAVFAGLGVSNSSGIAFSHIELTTAGVTDPWYAFRINNSSNISFSAINAHGDANAAPSSQINGFYITNSTGVQITNSNIHNLNGGIVANNDTGVSFSSNTFSYLDKGGIEMGGTSNATLNNNSFTNFEVSQGTHPDAIQIYTQGTTTAAHDIVISGNSITRGVGDAVQGIFVQDEVGNIPVHNLAITNNEVVGGMWDSIYVSGASGAVNVSNNVVATWAGLDMEGSGTAAAASAAPVTTNFQGYIWMLGNLSGASVTESGNVAQAYLNAAGVAATPAGNTVIGAVADAGAGWLAAWAQAQTTKSSISATAANLIPRLSAVSHSVAETGSQSGNVLTEASASTGLSVTSVGIGSAAAKAVAGSGSSFVGQYGTLTIHNDGTYTYAETHGSLQSSVVYDDHFTVNTVSQSGVLVNTTLDFLTTGESTGTNGSDTIYAGPGNQTITGGLGSDILISGTGKDTFVYKSVADSPLVGGDTIRGFKAGDVIDVSAVDPLFHVVSKFDHHPNELMIMNQGNGNWSVYGDTTGSGTANFQVHLTGVVGTITAASLHM